MNVPNIEKKTFRDMTAEEHSAIIEARIGKNLECLHHIEGWSDLNTNYLWASNIPWEHIKPEFKWAVVCQNGNVWFSSEKPDLHQSCWHFGWGGFHQSNTLNIDTSGIDWRESLTQRPEN